MVETRPTIQLEEVPGYPALKMTWQHHINKAEIRPAFQQIVDVLQVADRPVYIVMDLSNDPQFPMVDTMMGALRGPFRHPNLAEWLVFDANQTARWIGDLLTKATRRTNIRWFDNQDDLYAYLDKVTSDSDSRHFS